MSSKVKIAKIICPHCGRQISSFNSKADTLLCPFCGQKSVNPLVKKGSIDAPELVLPFSLCAEDFVNMFAKSLCKKPFLPWDLLEAVQFEELMRLYLPMYLYTGSFTSSWNCTEHYSVKLKSGKTSQRKRQARGRSEGNYAILCLATADEELPPELRAFARTMNYPDAASVSSEADTAALLAGGFYTYEPTLDPRQLWQSRGRKHALQEAEAAAKAQAPSRRSNFKCSSRLNENLQGACLLVPFCYTHYRYKDEAGWFIADGTGTYSTLKAPKDNRQVTALVLCAAAGAALGLLPGLSVNLLYMAAGALLGAGGFCLYAAKKRRDMLRAVFPKAAL